jgi:hypothetical protein
MEVATREASVDFVAGCLIDAGIRPAAYNGGQAWSFFEKLARKLSLDNPYAQYFWHASLAEQSAFIDTYNKCYIGF